MSNIPYTDFHIDTIMIVVDIEYRDGTFQRGVLAHSLEFECLEDGYNLKLYKSLQDVFSRTSILYPDVKRIEVLGVRL